ncbi:MAG: hypothetical protein QXO15_00940 [Nitrososphaerota archaeon]
MSTVISLLIKGVDEASEVMRSIAENVETSLDQTKDAAERLRAAFTENWRETKNLIASFSQIATSAFSLYQAFDRLHDSQLNLQRANIQVQASLNALQNEQAKYNAVIEKYGVDSQQAQAALRELQIAQERYQYALERANLIQSNFNELIVQSALGIIPTFINIIDGVKRAKEAWTAAQLALNAALNANPIMLIITAIGTLTGIIIYAYQTCEPFRNAVNAIGEALMNILHPALKATQAAWDSLCRFLGRAYETFIKPVIEGIKWLTETLNGAASTTKKILRDFTGAIEKSLSNAGQTIQNFISSICFAHAIHNAVKSAEKDLTKFTDTVNECMNRAHSEIKDFNARLSGLGLSTQTITIQSAAPPITIQINAPLVNVEGNADRRVVELAVRMIQERLKTVLIEPTSHAAPTKRIHVAGGLI